MRWLGRSLSWTGSVLSRKKSGPRSRGQLHVIYHVKINFSIRCVSAPQQAELRPTGGVVAAPLAGVTSPLRELLLAGSRPLWKVRGTGEPVLVGASAHYQLLESSLPCSQNSTVGHGFPPCVKINYPDSFHRPSQKEIISPFFVHTFSANNRGPLYISEREISPPSILIPDEQLHTFSGR